MASRWMVRAQAARGASVYNARWRGMSSASQGEEAPGASSPSSWFQRIKNMFIKSDSKSPSQEVKESQVPKPSSPPKEVAAAPAVEQPSPSPLQSMASKVVHTVKAAISGPYSMESFADEMKNARRAESLAKHMKGMPKNREHVVVSVLERQERILRTLATYKTEQFDAQQKDEVAKQCGGNVLEVEEILAKYAWAKEAHNRVEKLRKEGKPLPKNLKEVEAMMGGSYKSPVAQNTKVGRNDTCPCGSGKKYKRCCATAYS